MGMLVKFSPTLQAGQIRAQLRSMQDGTEVAIKALSCFAGLALPTLRALEPPFPAASCACYEKQQELSRFFCFFNVGHAEFKWRRLLSTACLEVLDVPNEAGFEEEVKACNVSGWAW